MAETQPAPLTEQERKILADLRRITYGSLEIFKVAGSIDHWNVTEQKKSK